MNLSEVPDDDIVQEYRSRIRRINADKKKKDVTSFANMLIQKVNENPDNVSANIENADGSGSVWNVRIRVNCVRGDLELQ